MKKKLLLGVLFIGSLIFAQNNSVGINTNNPDPSAILEINAEPQHTDQSTSKKGLLIPRVSLLSSTDNVTIPAPALGLMVYNTESKGTYPNNVNADTYYFWDGAKWLSMPLKSFVEEAVKPRVFYIEGYDTQSFTPSEINYAVGTPVKNNVVTFASSATINVANIITKNTDNTFTVNVSGLYDFSAYVNYNPMNITANSTVPNGHQRAFLNVKIQRLAEGSTNWVDTNALSRIGWGRGISGALKTANIISFPLQLHKNDRFRLAIANAMDTSANNDHGHDGNPYIGTQANSPVSKSIRVQLLDFNL